MMAGDVAGREQELDSIHAFLDRPVEGPAGLVLEGEAGIGKSTVWRVVQARATPRAALAVFSRPGGGGQSVGVDGAGGLLVGRHHRRVPRLVSAARQPPRRAV